MNAYWEANLKNQLSNECKNNGIKNTFIRYLGINHLCKLNNHLSKVANPTSGQAFRKSFGEMIINKIKQLGLYNYCDTNVYDQSEFCQVIKNTFDFINPHPDAYYYYKAKFFMEVLSDYQANAIGHNDYDKANYYRELSNFCSDLLEYRQKFSRKNYQPDATQYSRTFEFNIFATN